MQMFFALFSSLEGLALGSGFAFCISPERRSYAGGDLAQGNLQPLRTSGDLTQSMP